jgi:ubiquitin-protein ligase
MSTPQEIRNTRLKNDHQDMCNIRGPIIQWRAVKGAPPFVEKYELAVNIRSIISSRPDYRDQHVITIEMPSDYPNSQPLVQMVSDPGVFHPNWFTYKTWCPGFWRFSEGLGLHVIRMLRTLQYDLVITNKNSAANRDAKSWYEANCHRNLFPCDTQNLPSPLKAKKFEVQTPANKKFDIQGQKKI